MTQDRINRVLAGIFERRPNHGPPKQEPITMSEAHWQPERAGERKYSPKPPPPKLTAVACRMKKKAKPSRTTAWKGAPNENPQWQDNDAPEGMRQSDMESFPQEGKEGYLDSEEKEEEQLNDPWEQGYEEQEMEEEWWEEEEPQEGGNQEMLEGNNGKDNEDQEEME